MKNSSNKKSNRKINRVDKVAAWRLCMGCGACKYICSNEAISLVDIPDRGIRPVIDDSKCENCEDCLKVCPGICLQHEKFSDEIIHELSKFWGPILQIYEGYANDPEIRFKGSSGGIATAIALYCLEQNAACGVLHTGTDPENPLVNIPVFSTNKEQLLNCAGSRYAPAAPCQAFDIIREADGACVFIGKPCDIAALRKAQKLDPVLDNKVLLTISIFCAGTPTSNGTLQLLKELDVKPEQIKELRYRGCGWPGMFSVQLQNDENPRQMTYENAWGNILSKHGQLRCRLCPDPTGEFADISCGDPWYRNPSSNESGQSLILTRTLQGSNLLQEAKKAGFVSFEEVSPNLLPQSQESVLKRRQQLWGRLFTMRMIMIPIPVYQGFHLFKGWQKISIKAKMESIASTLKRIITRKWFKPL